MIRGPKVVAVALLLGVGSWALAAQTPASAEVTFRLIVVNSADRAQSLLSDIGAGASFGQLYAYDGEMGQAIAQFEAARRIAETDVPAAMPHMIQSFGVAHLHKAEMDNGRNNCDGTFIDVMFTSGLATTNHQPPTTNQLQLSHTSFVDSCSRAR